MTRQQQEYFAIFFMEEVEKKIMADMARVPENREGPELRAWIVSRYTEAAAVERFFTRKRKANFLNDLAVNNI